MGGHGGVDDGVTTGLFGMGECGSSSDGLRLVCLLGVDAGMLNMGLVRERSGKSSADLVHKTISPWVNH